mgnify:CR=1 FL=1
MNTLKTILAITGLVLIGFIAGFYVHRQMSMHFIGHVMEMRQPQGFEDHFVNRLNLDQEQLQQIRPIIKRYSGNIGELHQEFRDSRHHMIDSMHQEIRPYLNADQIEKMEHFSRRFRHDMKKRRKNFHAREKMGE